MNVALSVQTGKFELETESMVDICPLCSQFEDHAHAIKLSGGQVADEIDGDPLPIEGRKFVLALLHGEEV